jgi:predicted O-methyltransferase YrrM
MKISSKKKLELIKKTILNIKNPKILELGVQNGLSTKMFLEVCNANNGELISIDIEDCSNVANDKRWTFIKSSDDNFKYINKILPKSIDVLFIDSLHEPLHVRKVFYNYFKFLNINGYIFIDDISWLPYTKNKINDNDFVERINKLTFYKILEIYNQNINNISLNFNFEGTGLAIIKKIKKFLNKDVKIPDRSCSIKNLLKKIYAPMPKM